MSTNRITREFRKSSRSPSAEECVEVAVGPDDVGFQDTKNRRGGTLWFSSSAHAAFLAKIKGSTGDAS